MSPIAHALALLVFIQQAPAEDWTPSAEQAAVYQALSVRDAPDCAAVEALATDPLDALRTVVEHAAMPPWAPMRAAHCMLTRHPDQARDDLLSWVGQAKTRGLGLLVLSELDTLAEPLALEIAGAALAGPLADDARPRLADSAVPSVKALATGGGD